MLASEASIRVFYGEAKEPSRRGRGCSGCVPRQPRRSAQPTAAAPPDAGGCPEGEMHPEVEPSAHRGEGRGRGWAPCVERGTHGVPAATRGGRHSNGRTASPIGAVGTRRGGHGDSHTPGAGTAGEREGCETALAGRRRECGGKETDFERGC